MSADHNTLDALRSHISLAVLQLDALLVFVHVPGVGGKRRMHIWYPTRSSMSCRGR